MSVIASDRSAQTVVSVIETEHQRFLLRDDYIVGAEHRHPAARDQMAFSAMALMASVAFLTIAPQSVLCLGLGAGTVPNFLRSRGLKTDVIEIDEAVIRMAGQHYAFGAASTGSGAVMHADVLQVISAGDAGKARYDVVLSDLWSGGNEGRSLMRPFFARLKAGWLREGGVLAVNVVAFAGGPHVGLARDVVCTLRSVFAHVAVFAEYDPHGPNGDADAFEPANLLLLASDAQPPEHSVPSSYTTLEDGLPPPPNSMEDLFARFTTWRPPALQRASEGKEGTVLETPSDWAARLPERQAVAHGMRAQQRALLPAEAWNAVARLLEDAEDKPPRRVGSVKAPPPFAAVSSKEEL